MRATPRERRLANTMTRWPSCSVMSEGRCGFAGSGGCASSAAPSAMPTRSAPSARAFALMASAVKVARKIDTMSGLVEHRLGRAFACGLRLLEVLQLARHHPLVALGPDPAAVPVVQARDRLTFGAVLLVS